jgi:hypothetical protein
MTRSIGLVFMTAVFFTVPGTAAAEEVSVSELVTNSEAMSGSEVTVEGEPVGDYGFRDDGWMWTQLNGDDYVHAPIGDGGKPTGGNTGVGVRMPLDLGEQLDPPGGYRNRGPIVRVTGIWKHHDPGRQGESYLEVTSLTVVEPGRLVHQDPQWTAMLVGLAFIAGSLVLWRTSRRPLNRSK